MNDTSKGNCKRYDEAFKRQAVERWLVSGKSGRQIASELGINKQSLKVWKRQFKQGPASGVARRWTRSKPGTGSSPESLCGPHQSEIEAALEADAIFLGARGLHHGGRLALGTMASAVAGRAHCSVEIVRKS